MSAKRHMPRNFTNLTTVAHHINLIWKTLAAKVFILDCLQNKYLLQSLVPNHLFNPLRAEWNAQGVCFHCEQVIFILPIIFFFIEIILVKMLCKGYLKNFN